MMLTFELDLDSVKTNQHAKYLGQRPFRSKVIARPYRRTHWTNCSTEAIVKICTNGYYNATRVNSCQVKWLFHGSCCSGRKTVKRREIDEH